MRTVKEVQKMLGKAVNVSPFMKEDTKTRQVKDKLYCIVQALNWVLQSDDADLTKRIEGIIQSLIDEGSAL